MASSTVDRLPVWSSVLDDAHACHEVCCDPDRAVCGEDVTSHDWASSDAPTTCPLCAAEPGCPTCGAT